MPSILFLNEMDAISARKGVFSGEVERLVISGLVGLIAGLEEGCKMVVVVATRNPYSLDPLLRRAGCIDIDIAIPVPNREARLEILSIQTKGMPLSEDIDLEELAELTEGFVGAELKALCQRAVFEVLCEVLYKADPRWPEITAELSQGLKVSQTHFLEAMKKVNPVELEDGGREGSSGSWT